MTDKPWFRVTLTALALVVLALAHWRVLDAPAEGYADAALKRALVTFAVARTLNGVISVAQGTEVALQPAGVGVTLVPGQLLDPVNDLIERFSWVMLASTTSLGIQSMLLTMSAWWVVSAAFGLAVIAYLALTWLPGPVSSAWRPWVYRFLLAIGFVRFAVPLLLLATSGVSATFLQPEQQRATEALRTSSVEIETLAEQVAAPEKPPGEELSLVDRLTDFVDEHLPSADVKARVAALETRLSDVSEQVVDLIVAFVLETIVVPLAFLWLLARSARAMLGRFR